MNIILTPVGSAGDVNPFVVIGRELRRRGHRVTLLAAEPFADVAANAGLIFVPVGSADEYERITKDPDLWHPRRGPQVVIGTIAGNLRLGYAAIEQVYEPGRTMLVGHALSLSTRVFEEVHAAPAATLQLAPSVFRSAFRQPAMPTGLDISAWPGWLKRTVWWAVDRFGIDPLIAPALNAWRAEFGLPPVSRIFNDWLHSPQLVLGLFPDWFGDPQPDWPPQLLLTGFVLSDAGCAPGTAARVPAGRGQPPASADDLELFLASGEPPVVFTPGSANRHAAPFFRTAIDATARIGRRALLVTSYGEHLPSSLPEHAHHAAYASFSTLFPRAAAVVHHGGIGTCAQALAAGVPQLVMPMGFDQPDNALCVTRLGAGESIPLNRFQAPKVAEALDRLISSRDVAAACRRCRERIAATDAVARACDALEEQYRQFPGRRSD